MFAVANVVADIWKGLGLNVVAALVRQRHRFVGALLGVLWTVALIFGVASSMGVYVQDRTAMVGGRDWNASKVNLAVGRDGGGAGRQAGSTFKPFLLAETVHEGFGVRSTFDLLLGRGFFNRNREGSLISRECGTR